MSTLFNLIIIDGGLGQGVGGVGGGGDGGDGWVGWGWGWVGVGMGGVGVSSFSDFLICFGFCLFLSIFVEVCRVFC